MMIKSGPIKNMSTEVAKEVYRHLAYVKNGVKSGLIVTIPYLFYDSVINTVMHVTYYDAVKLFLEPRFVYMDIMRLSHLEIFQKCFTKAIIQAKMLTYAPKEFNFVDQPVIEEPGDTILELNNKLLGT